jgi:hypothetical protein
LPKVNVYNLARPARRVESRDFAENGETLSLAFHKPDAADLAMAAERAEKLVADWIEGNPETGRGPAPFPYPDVKLSRLLCNNVAVAVECQEADDPAERYDEIEFLLMSARLPESWLQIQRLLQELTASPPAPSPNGASPAAPTG